MNRNYKAEQAESRQRIRGGFCHPNAKPGQKIKFEGSGDRYRILANGSRVLIGLKLSKAERKQAKRQRRIDRRRLDLHQTLNMFSTLPFAPNTEGVWLGLPAEEYRKAPGVSQSRLKEFDSHATPLHYMAAPQKAVTVDMEFGTICHTAILEPTKLPEAYYVQPETYPSEDKKKGTIQKPWNGNSNWCDAWLQEHGDRPVIKQEKANRIPKIAERVSRLPEFGSALQHGQREVSFFKRDQVTGLLLKARVDCIATADDGLTWIFDLKKVQSGAAGFKAFQEDILSRGYHIQGASYLHITGASRFVFVPFDDDEPFDACQWELDRDMLRFGLAEYRRILNAFAECYNEDRWPGYATGIQPMPLPHWAQKRLNEV